MESFYRQVDDDVYESTEHTIGPWSMDAQHAGPPSALIGRAVERTGDNTDFHVVRLTFEILRPVPVSRLTAHAEVVRPGRSVELLEASLGDEKGDVMKARAWRIRISGPHDLDAVNEEHAPPPPPESGTDVVKPDHGYLGAMDTRFIKGAFLEKGPGIAWFRMRHPLVNDEEPTPLQRVLIAADSGNGISAPLDWAHWWFINPDLTVYVHRPPTGEWICLDAESTARTTGIGVAASTIYDTEGRVGYGLQGLFIGAR